MWPHLNIIARVTDSFQCTCLADVKGGDVGVTQAESLPQVGISFKKVLVSSNLSIQRKKRNRVVSYSNPSYGKISIFENSSGDSREAWKGIKMENSAGIYTRRSEICRGKAGDFM